MNAYQFVDGQFYISTLGQQISLNIQIGVFDCYRQSPPLAIILSNLPSLSHVSFVMEIAHNAGHDSRHPLLYRTAGRSLFIVIKRPTSVCADPIPPRGAAQLLIGVA
jgi:hypothetical protein